MPARKLLKVCKSNDLNQASFNHLGLSAYRVFLNIITKIRRYDSNGNPIENTLINREYSLSIAEYSEEFNIPKNTAYKALKQVADKLMDTKHLLKETDESGNKKWEKINLCSKASYIDGSGKIDIRFTEDIMPHLTELSDRFTMYNLCEITNFKSFYTTRMYELLMQYKTTGKLDISVEELRQSLNCIKTHKLYNDFKRFGFNHAIKEINSQYDIGVQFKEVKKGKTVERIEFTFKKTMIDKVYDPVTKKVRNQLIRPNRITTEKTENKNQENQTSSVSSILLDAFRDMGNKLRINK